ncbi:hypothetical protein [Flavobacterium hibernum]|uniref:Uncharacterized protein n=1 Tax=Flavobacterium hibernum TaxID=37752 RepID=A0A0D0EZA2_9FLAO|nr:hypothetical protein [Flavobacterium hibernum]KIO50962.1 hypothetical protein IW18_20475 [Flavobacterium hibernum]OXA85206.1 hypothetical protein B0A73_17815 [Flavobacterium hibernum]STO11342.1 Uncharacterised protein [Flavobacterium hibernum]
MTHSEALEEINRRIGGWFGTADKIFGGHKMDEDRAKEARKLAAASGVTLDEIVQMADEYFDKENLHAELREKNMKRIKKLFGTKLQ